MIGSHQDFIGAIVSFWSLVIFTILGWIWMIGRQMSLIVQRLIMAGFVAPIPMKWSEITHWRYTIRSYFFFLYALVLHGEGAAARQAERDASRIEPTPSDPAMGVKNSLVVR